MKIVKCKITGRYVLRLKDRDIVLTKGKKPAYRRKK
jgi:hypothetical protein